MTIINSCGNVINDIFTEMGDEEEDSPHDLIKEDSSESKQSREYYNNMQVLGNMYESFKEGFSNSDVREKVASCILFELDKQYPEV